MHNLISTQEITSDAEYFPSGKAFFLNFSEYWKSVEGQVLKIETRQVYREPENASYKHLMESSDIDGAVKLIPSIRNGDIGFYTGLRERKIDFVRCRPVEFPLSMYLRWELECYVFNSTYCERIFLSERKDVNSIFSNLIQHDFMVFDEKVAFIHDYDDSGLIRGGWKTRSLSNIQNLILIFSLVKSKSVEFQKFLKNHNYELIYHMVNKNS